MINGSFSSLQKKFESRICEVMVLNEIPKVPSHYCRSTSSRVNMHAIYSEWCAQTDKYAVKRKLFTNTINEQKLSIFKPRKDQCDVCVGHKEGNIDNEVFNLHITKKNEARAAKERANGEISSNVLVVTMDMQSVLTCPKLLVSEQYYKTKLAIHNFTFYIKNSKDVHLYIWHEGNGGVVASNITSCIVNFVEKYSGSYKKIILISDGCAYQNKNKTLCSAFGKSSCREKYCY